MGEYDSMIILIVSMLGMNLAMTMGLYFNMKNK